VLRTDHEKKKKCSYLTIFLLVSFIEKVSEFISIHIDINNPMIVIEDMGNVQAEDHTHDDLSVIEQQQQEEGRHQCEPVSHSYPTKANP
jgi:hypothetical protein